MRIVYFIAFRGIAGRHKVIFEQVNRLIDRGHEASFSSDPHYITQCEDSYRLPLNFLSHPEERDGIDRGAQNKVLKDHTYTKRMEDLIEVIRNSLTVYSNGERNGGLSFTRI